MVPCKCHPRNTNEEVSRMQRQKLDERMRELRLRHGYESIMLSGDEVERTEVVDRGSYRFLKTFRPIEVADHVEVEA
jgi:hypothetical protein